MKESKYQKRIVRYLKDEGFLVWYFSTKAAPDLLCIGPVGLPNLFIEVKSNKKRYSLTPGQARILEELAKRGHIALILDHASDPDYNDLRQMVNRLKMSCMATEGGKDVAV